MATAEIVAWGLIILICLAVPVLLISLLWTLGRMAYEDNKREEQTRADWASIANNTEACKGIVEELTKIVNASKQDS